MEIPSRVIDITGEVFGKLTAVEYVGKNTSGKSSWSCNCECGNRTIVTSNDLRQGKTTSCGCYQKEVVSMRYDEHREKMIGKTFGRLVVKSIKEIREGTTYYDCMCSCGGRTILPNRALISGNTMSCGCLGIENRMTHGLSNHPLYQVYTNMKARCSNQNTPSYHRYGGRGVEICKDWLEDFQEFYDWAVRSGYSPGLSIERNDNDGNYEPGNCSWVPMTEQAQNRVSTKLTPNEVAEIRGDPRRIKDIALSYSLDQSTVSRIKSKNSWKSVE